VVEGAQHFHHLMISFIYGLPMPFCQIRLLTLHLPECWNKDVVLTYEADSQFDLIPIN